MQRWGSKLKCLNLSSTKISGEGVRATCPQLETLIFWTCQNITDAGLNNMLQHVGHKLRFLDLRHTKVTGTGVTAKCPVLEKINFDYCRNLKDAGLETMLHHSGGKLKSLVLEYTKISGAGIKLSACPLLEHLDMRNCRISRKVKGELLQQFGCKLKI